MIVLGNFSGDPNQCYAMGKDAFKKAYKGKVNVDINKLWAMIEKSADKEVKTKKK